MTSPALVLLGALFMAVSGLIVPQCDNGQAHDSPPHTQAEGSHAMPDLTGLPPAAALATLDAAGLALDGLIVGKGPAVVAQLPGPGEPVAPGDAVAITVGDPRAPGTADWPAR